MSGSDLLTLLLERSPSALLVLSREGQVTRVNGEGCRLFGLDAGRLVGKPVLATVAPADRDRVKQLFLRVLEGTEREWIARFQRGDGATRVQWVRAVPLGGDGDPAGIVMFTRDVTEHRSGRPETLQLQTLFENLPGQMVAVVDRSGRIRYTSGMSRTHFIDDLEVLGTEYGALLEPGEAGRGRVEEMLDELAQGRDWAGTHRHRRRDGTLFPMRVFASPYRDPRNGKLLGGLLVGRDAAHEEELRERCARAERLAEIGGALSEVAGRFDRALVRLEAAVAKGTPEVGLPEPCSVPREVAGLRALTAALEEMAALAPPARRALSAVEVAREVVEELSPRLAAWGAVVRISDAAETGSIEADPIQLREALALLVEAAAVPDARVDLSVAPTPEGVRIRVHPLPLPVEGGGVEGVFEPFALGGDGAGGLALTRVRALVRAHGGSVGAEPLRGGAGVRVTLALPALPPDASVRFRPAPLALAGSRSVLVVDDEAPVRDAIRRFLEKVGFEVREAWSGRSALAQITVGSPPEMVLTDMKMSDGSGSWFLEQLARDFPDLLRRTVVITGEVQQGEVAGLLRGSGCPVLQKPVELPHLLDVLDEVAAR